VNLEKGVKFVEQRRRGSIMGLVGRICFGKN